MLQTYVGVSGLSFAMLYMKSMRLDLLMDLDWNDLGIFIEFFFEEILAYSDDGVGYYKVVLFKQFPSIII